MRTVVVIAAALAAAPFANAQQVPVIKNEIRPSPARLALPGQNDIEVEGNARGARDVRAGLETVNRDLQACSTGLVATDPGMHVTLVIDASGAVQRATVDDAVPPDNPRAACVQKALEGATFSPANAQFQAVRFRLAPEAVSEGGVAAVGPLSAERIQSVIEQHGDDVRACYTDSVAQEDGVVGAVALRFTIDRQGNVVDVTEDHMDPGLRQVARCVAVDVAKWKFPASSGNTVVVYPFEF